MPSLSLPLLLACLAWAGSVRRRVTWGNVGQGLGQACFIPAGVRVGVRWPSRRDPPPREPLLPGSITQFSDFPFG